MSILLISLVFCYNRIPYTRCLKQQTFISHCSEGWESELSLVVSMLRCQHGQIHSEGLLPAFQITAFLLIPHMERERELWSLHLIKVLAP